jgi:hypothetical protein
VTITAKITEAGIDTDLITETPDGIMTLALDGGGRISFGPATTETGEAAEGWDWAAYDAADKIEAQDWAETDGAMAAALARYAG